MKLLIYFVLVLALVGILTANRLNGEEMISTVCVEYQGCSMDVSINAIPSFVSQGAIVGCVLEEKNAFNWFMESSPSNKEMKEDVFYFDELLADYYISHSVGTVMLNE